MVFSGDLLVDTAGVKDEYKIESPVFTGPVHMQDGDATPFFFNDTTLIFASRIAGGQGGADVYASVYSAGAWSNPLNLGPEINTPYDEICPFLAKDGRTLYFSSNHDATAGGFDVFKCVYDPLKKQWSKAVNLGFPINSPADDTYFRLSNDGKSAFLASDRMEGLGENDLYQVYFKETQPEQLAENSRAGFAQPVVALPADQPELLTEFESPALAYDTDKDLVSPDNLKLVQAFAEQARRFPETSVLITVHTHETGPAKFDLYNGIKRAEILGKQLTDWGLPAGRIQLRSVGAGYPIARNVLDAAPNPFGQKLNRRVEMTLAVPNDQAPVKVQIRKPAVAAVMRAGADQVLDSLTAGVSFKVEIAVARQILNNDDLGMYTDLMIESQPGSGAFRYTAGWSKQFATAKALRDELEKRGFEGTTVVAYINGIRISKAEAVGIVKKYPELARYIKP
jgi:outer membrane protein OmpA-like peptidoglycan-associated protein